MTKKNGKPLSGGARLTASGRSPVAVALDVDQKKSAKEAAKIEGRSLANLFVFHTMRAVEKILAKRT